MPEASTVSAQAVETTRAWYSSNPCVWYSMKSRSSTDGSLSADSRTALATPRIKAMSPPMRTCTAMLTVWVVWKAAMLTNSCGTIVRLEAASINGRLMRTLQSTKRFANQRESIFPGDRLVFVGLGVVEQRLGEPTCCFEIVVAPRRKLAHGMGGEEIAVGVRLLKLPGSVLDAVFADVEFQPGRVIRPRAAGTIETTVLMVHHEDRAKTLDRFARPCEDASDAFGRAPP